MSQTIVIVGAGIYGISTANRLSKSAPKDVAIKLVTLSNYTANICATVRVSVQNDTKAIYKIKDMIDERVEVVVDEVIEIKKDSLVLKTKGDLSFTALVVATGSIWSDPLVNTHTFKDDYKSYYDEQHQKLKDAKHIVLVGGGFNNIELLGELMYTYKKQLASGEKKITIVHNGDKLLPNIDRYSDRLRRRVTDYLVKHKDIEIIFNSKGSVLEDGKTVEVVTGKSVKTIKADLAITSFGNTPSVPPHSLDNFCDKDGFISVKDTFQTVDYPKIFAIGDVNNFEYKGLVHREAFLAVLENNLLNFVKNPQSSSNLKNAAKPTGPQACVVTLGPEHAYGQFPTFFGTIPVPTWYCISFKAKELFRDQSRELFHS